MSFLIKPILWKLALSLSAPAAADKTQWLVHIGLNLTLKLINGISNDTLMVQQLLRFMRFYDLWAILFPNN